MDVVYSKTRLYQHKFNRKDCSFRKKKQIEDFSRTETQNLILNLLPNLFLYEIEHQRTQLRDVAMTKRDHQLNNNNKENT